MDRGGDLSSDSSLRCGPKMTNSQSPATVTDHSGSPSAAMMDEQEEEKELKTNSDECAETGALDCGDLEEWHKELDEDESVNLFSVTICTVDVPCEEETVLPQPQLSDSDVDTCDELPLLHTFCHTVLPQPDVDTDEIQPHRSYYMHHQL
ncbi:hypothetical protein WMY93_001754 [Mugilogobius chulae]|uniref:Uncharacterized protein n=1 Tax=Mugilogobius chulae TaxID=88201 RepID=A0AAW0PSX2_9GOBI